MQIGILEPDNFSPDAGAALARLGTVHAWDGDDLGQFLANVEVLFIRLAHRIDAAFLAMAPRLRYLCTPTTGYTHLDEAALAARNIKVLSLRGERAFLESIRATPEHTFGLILGLLRRYQPAFAHTIAGGWDRDQFRGEELYGNKVGIIGLGRVGYRVASYCEAFGAQVFWCDPNDVQTASSWQRMPDALAVIAASRIVVLCASYQSGQPPVLGPKELESMTDRYLVNTARGELVDEAALLAAISNDALAGVATDVVANENGENALSRWRTLALTHNVILTPHIGGATVDAMAKTECFIVQKLADALADRATQCC